MNLERIGPYRIEGRLGAGGMGEVFRGWDTELDRSVALKLIHAKHHGNPSTRERFRREAKAIAKLDHPAIVRIHHVQELEGRHCLVMEHVEGETLSSLIERGPMAPEQAVPLLAQIAEGLAAAHAEGIVHRDLKTSNVMVTPAGQAKILDFGIAKRLERHETSLSVTGAIVGTLHTMSPEQATGAPVGPAADLFALGVLAYEILTGISPFRGDTASETVARVLGHQPTSPMSLVPAIPGPLSALVNHLLAKDPAGRPVSAQAVVDRLRSSGATSTTLGPGPVARTSPHRSTPSRSDAVLAAPANELETIGPGGSTVVAVASPPESRNEPTMTGALWVRGLLGLGVVLAAMLGAHQTGWFASREPRTVALMGFAADGVAESWRALVFEEMLLAELQAHPRIRVLESEWAAQIGRSLGIGPPLEAKDMTRLRQEIDPDLADLVVTGLWEGAVDGSVLRLQWRQDGPPYSGPSTEGKTLEVASKNLQKLAVDAADSIIEALNLDAIDLGIAGEFRALPTDPEALRYYGDAGVASRRHDALTARRHLARALEVTPDSAHLHKTMAGLSKRIGYEDAARRSASRALELASSLPRSAQYRLEAECFTLLEDFSAAADAYEWLYREHPDEIVFGIRWARAKAADASSDELEHLFVSLRDRVEGSFSGFLDQVEAQTRLDQGDANLAVELALSAIGVGQRTGILQLQAEGRLIEAVARERLGEHEQAARALGLAENLFERLGDERGVLDVIITEAITLAMQGHLAEARDQFETYGEFYERRGDRIGRAIVDANLASVLIELGELDRAEALLDPAIEILDAASAGPDLASAILNRAAVYQSMGQHPEARAAYERVLQDFRRIDDRSNEAITLVNLGELRQIAGDLDGAAEKLEEALAIDREIESVDGQIYELVRLAEVAVLQNDPKKGRAHLREARQLVESLHDGLRSEARADIDLALAELELESSNAGEASRLAAAARAAFTDLEGRPDRVAMSKIVEVQALLLERAPDIERARALSREVEIRAARSQDRGLRFEAELLMARLESMSAEPELAEIRRRLTELAGRAESSGLLLDAALVRLTLGEIETALGAAETASGRLVALREKSAEKGWRLFEARATRLLVESRRRAAPRNS